MGGRRRRSSRYMHQADSHEGVFSDSVGKSLGRPDSATPRSADLAKGGAVPSPALRAPDVRLAYWTMTASADTWILHHFMEDDKEVRVAVDLSLADDAPDTRMPVVTRVVVQVPGATARLGFSVRHGEVLDMIVDGIIEASRRPLRWWSGRSTGFGPVTFAGRITAPDRVTLCFYSAREIPETTLVALGRRTPGVSFEILSRVDRDWLEYRHHLHPGAALNPLILTSAQLDLRRADGDNLGVVREVNHIVRFQSSQAREAFVVFLEGRQDGWRVAPLSPEDAVERPFWVQVTPRHDLQPATADIYVSFLVNLAEKHEGVYDGWGAPVIKR